MLSADTLSKLDKTRDIANLSSASKDPLDVLGITYLFVDIHGYCVRQPFVVVSELSCDVLLGITYIDQHVENLWVRKRTAILKDGTTVPLHLRQSRTNVHDEKEPIEVPTPEPPPLLVKMAQKAVLEPQSETVIPVVVKQSGSFLLEGSQKIYDKHSCSIANGIVNTTADKQFAIKIANFSSRKITLHKHQIVGTATAAPMIGFVFPDNKGDKGHLENIYTGQRVRLSDLPPNPVPPRSRTSKPCLLRHLTGHLCDGTCQAARLVQARLFRVQIFLIFPII